MLQSYTLYLHSSKADKLHLDTGAVKRNIQRYLPVNRPSAYQSLTGSYQDLFVKSLICTEEDHAHHSHCLISDFCLLSPAPPPQHVHAPRPQTIISEGSAKHLMECATKHMAWQLDIETRTQRMSLMPKTKLPCTTGPPYAGGRQRFI